MFENYAADGLIATAVDAINLTNFSEDAADSEIDAINAGNSMDCDDITVSDDAAYTLIATAIDSGNFTDCAEDAAGGLNVDIDSGISINCDDLLIQDYAADRLIATPINEYGFIATTIYSTDCYDTNIFDDVVDRLMMLMC